MRLRTTLLPFVVFAAISTAAEAASHREAPIIDYDVFADDNDGFVVNFVDVDNLDIGTGQARLGGRITVRTRPDLGPRSLVLDDIDAFDLELTIRNAALPEGFPTDFSFTFDILKAGAGLDLFGSLRSNREVLEIDTTGLSQTPIFQLQAPSGPESNSFEGFPLGRAPGPDASVVLALFSGSVNVGLALLPDGFAGPPGLVGIGQLSPDDRIVFAREDLVVAPVPLPMAGGMLLLAGAPLAYAWRRRRLAA